VNLGTICAVWLAAGVLVGGCGGPDAAQPESRYPLAPPTGAPAPQRSIRRPAASTQSLFSPEQLGLIEPPDRAQWDKPEQIMDALGIAEGSVVADLGAGGGWFIPPLARRVGPNGLVYAEDIQAQMIEIIRRRVQRENLRNVRTVLGTARNPGLPPGLDVVLIVGAYHEIEDPVALLENAGHLLKPQGRIGIVDFTPGGGGPGPEREERVDPEAVIRSAAAAGLQLRARELVPPFLFLLEFQKQPDAEARQ
jgi:SAM-dependent methyltransferase